MKDHSYLYIIIMFLLAGCQTMKPLAPAVPVASNLPQLRDQYKWEIFKEPGVAVASPVNWYRAVTKSPLAYTGSISREDYYKYGPFKTGFTIQAVAAVSRRTGSLPSLYAIRMGEEISKLSSNKIISTRPMRVAGTYKVGTVEYRNSPSLGDKITVKKAFIASDSTDILFILTFESPNKTWHSEYNKHGKYIFNNIWFGDRKIRIP